MGSCALLAGTVKVRWKQQCSVLRACVDEQSQQTQYALFRDGVGGLEMLLAKVDMTLGPLLFFGHFWGIFRIYFLLRPTSISGEHLLHKGSFMCASMQIL
jgi:hypothetical protein